MYPLLFIGHGTPLNAIEDNRFSKGWKDIASRIEKPRIILVISAHWVTRRLRVNSSKRPRTIYDFYYFPKKLYEIEYQVQGSPEMANKVTTLTQAHKTTNWGLDHGAWSILNVMYPNQDIKVFQLSIDYNKTPEELFKLGQALQNIRDEVMIIGSGNIVHNLRKANFQLDKGYNWAEKYDDFIHDKIMERDFKSIIDYDRKPESQLAFSTAEHFSPLLYVLGACTENDEIEAFNRACTYGSVSMTSYLFTKKNKA
ncbi:MAG: 4,5-DOPA dioxygenase extradiol [Bacilli bacterium]|nr:4,5-DOPA dioxygenase extradiol [Bacilli bacterium]